MNSENVLKSNIEDVKKRDIAKLFNLKKHTWNIIHVSQKTFKNQKQS